jgi:hypothetical protein
MLLSLLVLEVEFTENPPSNSQTLNSLPLVLTLTAFPLGVISAEETDEVWPHSLVPGEIERLVGSEVQRYKVRVLSGCVANI